jgi:hypothetical protein
MPSIAADSMLEIDWVHVGESAFIRRAQLIARKSS